MDIVILGVCYYSVIAATLAAWSSERGKIEQVNGFGCLYNRGFNGYSEEYMLDRTYDRNSPVYSTLGTAGLPLESKVGQMSNMATTVATAIHIDSYAMKRPGHIRRPKPNAATIGSRTSVSISRSRSSVPGCFFKNRSGLNCSG